MTSHSCIRMTYAYNVSFARLAAGPHVHTSFFLKSARALAVTQYYSTTLSQVPALEKMEPIGAIIFDVVLADDSLFSEVHLIDFLENGPISAAEIQLMVCDFKQRFPELRSYSEPTYTRLCSLLGYCSDDWPPTHTLLVSFRS